MATIKITAKYGCPYCQGEGYVYDIVDYGNTTARMPSLCACVEEQIPDDFDGDVEVVYESDPSDPPTQEKLYELTHAQDPDLYRHPRDCSCPNCDGSGDGWLEDEYDLKYESTDWEAD